MNPTKASARELLDDVVCDGVAIDVFHADQARRLLEEFDLFVAPINAKGLGKRFVANLQLILERHLLLSIYLLYEPYSGRNPSRSISAAIHLISAHADELQIADRQPVFDFLTFHGESSEDLACGSDEHLSRILVRYLNATLPQPNSGSGRPLDQALVNVKRVRDKALAHHDRVDRASLVVPAWAKLAELIGFARRFAVLIARSYLNVHHDLEHNAARAASSLRRLLKSAGLEPASGPGASSDDVLNIGP